jgi:hypothetical protein
MFLCGTQWKKSVMKNQDLYSSCIQENKTSAEISAKTDLFLFLQNKA